jgi:hypothetical protein
VHAVGDHQGFLSHAATLADALDPRVEPQIGVAALEGPLAKSDLLVERAA